MDKSTTNLVRASAVIVIFASIATIFQDEFRNLKRNLKSRATEQIESLEYQSQTVGSDEEKENNCRYLRYVRFSKEDFVSMENCKKVVLETYDVCSSKASWNTNKSKDPDKWNEAWDKCAVNKLKKAGVIK